MIVISLWRSLRYILRPHHFEQMLPIFSLIVIMKSAASMVGLKGSSVKADAGVVGARTARTYVDVLADRTLMKTSTWRLFRRVPPKTRRLLQPQVYCSLECSFDAL